MGRPTNRPVERQMEMITTPWPIKAEEKNITGKRVKNLSY